MRALVFIGAADDSLFLGNGGCSGLVLSMIAFYSDEQSLSLLVFNL